MVALIVKEILNMKRPYFMLLMICSTYYLTNLSSLAHAQTPTSSNSSGSEKFGELPPNPLTRWELAGVQAEICNEHLIEPSLVVGKVPSGFRFVTVAEHAKNDDKAAKILQAHPEHANYTFGILCFVKLDSLEIEGVRANTKGSTAFAFWWAPTVTTALFDKRARGDMTWIQLASWYPRSGINRAKILAIDPQAEFTSLKMVSTEARVWQIRLKMRQAEIKGSFRVHGDRKEMTYPLPQFSTVPLKTAETTYFSVFTYFGHHSQDLEGEWRAKGRHALARAIADSDRSSLTHAQSQDGWRAHAGIYKVER